MDNKEYRFFHETGTFTGYIQNKIIEKENLMLVYLTSDSHSHMSLKRNTYKAGEYRWIKKDTIREETGRTRPLATIKMHNYERSKH